MYQIQADDKQELRKVKFQDADFITSQQTLMRRICVAVAHKDGAIGVRDSKDPSRTTLCFSEAEWNAFVTGVKNGEFDFGL